MLQAAEQLGVARSTAHRLLAMLVYRDFAEQGNTRLYPGRPRLYPAGPDPESGQVLTRVARPRLQVLVAKVDETANLMVRIGTEVRFAATVECDQLLRVGDRPAGSSRPSARRATRRCSRRWSPRSSPSSTVTGTETCPGCSGSEHRPRARFRRQRPAHPGGGLRHRRGPPRTARRGARGGLPGHPLRQVPRRPPAGLGLGATATAADIQRDLSAAHPGQGTR